MQTTTVPTQYRAQIRASVQYLRTIRPIVQKIAVEHAAWARFVANVVSPNGSMSPREQALGASRFAGTFAGLRERLKRVPPTSACTALHVSAIAWVEALDLLATALPGAIQTGSHGELRAIAREANEAQVRLRVFQRTHAATVTALKQMFATRPRIGRPARRPLTHARPHAPARPTAAPTPINLPPWRRPRPALARRASGF